MLSALSQANTLKFLEGHFSLLRPLHFEGAAELSQGQIPPVISSNWAIATAIKSEVESERNASGLPCQSGMLASPSASAIEAARHNMKTSLIGLELAGGFDMDLMVGQEEHFPGFDFADLASGSFDTTLIWRTADVAKAWTHDEIVNSIAKNVGGS
jgi:hypothetical protein